MRTIIVFLIGFAWAQMACAADDKPYSEHLAANPTGTVQIHNVAGSVTVNGWDKSEVDIQGELGAAVERVEVTHTDDHIVIKVILPRNEGHIPDHGAEARLQVHVPQNSTLEVSTVSAPITVDGIHKATKLRTVSADVHAELAGADEEVGSVSGNVYVSGNPTVATLRTNTVNGMVKLTHGAGDISAHTVNGQLDLAADGAKSVDMHSVNGEIGFKGHLLADAKLNATSVNGKLSVQVSADGGYTYDTATFGGSVHTCFGAQNGSGPVNGQVGPNGPGRASVHLRTMRGGIELCDR